MNQPIQPIQPVQPEAPAPSDFQSELASRFLSVSLTTRAPRRTAKIPEVSEMLAASKGANVTGTIKVMPDELDKQVRAVVRSATSQMGQKGWPLTDGSNKTEYLTEITDVAGAYEMANEANEQIQRLVDNATADWPAFVESALKAAGDLELPATAFPYATRDDYMKQFSLSVRAVPVMVGNLGSLPAGVTQDIVEQMQNDSNRFFAHVLDHIRASLADECRDLTNKIASDSRVTSRTFNSIRQVSELAQKTSVGACQIIARVTQRVTRDLETLKQYPGVLGPNHPDNTSFDAEYSAQYKQMLLDMAAHLENAMAVPREH